MTLDPETSFIFTTLLSVILYITNVCCTATGNAAVTVAATNVDSTVAESSVSYHEPSVASGSCRWRHCSPHPYPHLVSKSLSSSASTDVSGRIVAADTTDTVAVPVSSLQTSDKMMSDIHVESSADVSASVADMSCDSDTECHAEVVADAANSTFTLTSPPAMSTLAHVERQATVNNLTSSVTRVHKASHTESVSPPSLPSGKSPVDLSS